MIKAVLFDLDGTLLDTAPDLVNALNRTLHDVGERPCLDPTIHNYASHGATGLLKQALQERFEEFDAAHLRQRLLDHYAADIASLTLLYPGVKETLEQLERSAIPWGIVTNKPGFLTDALLPHFEEFANCHVVVSGDTCGVAKPHPAPMLHAADQIGHPPEHILYIGDAERDMEAGNKVGMLTLVALWGYLAEHDEPEHWQGQGQIECPTELLQWFELS